MISNGKKKNKISMIMKIISKHKLRILMKNLRNWMKCKDI